MSVDEATGGTAGLESREVSGGRSSCCREKETQWQVSLQLVKSRLGLPRVEGKERYLCVIQTTALAEDFEPFQVDRRSHLLSVCVSYGGHRACGSRHTCDLRLRGDAWRENGERTLKYTRVPLLDRLG